MATDLEVENEQKEKSFFEELHSKCKNVLSYSGRDMIECEMTVIPNVLLVTWHPEKFIRGGKHVIDIQGDALKEVLKQVATENDVHQLQLISMEIGKKRKNYIKTLEEEINRERDGVSVSKVAVRPEDIEDKLAIWAQNNNQYREFFEKFGYQMPPIRHFKMIVNKGPAATDLVAKDTKDKELYAAMLEQNKAMMELIKSLTANSNPTAKK